jgi:MFS transporter, SET family, sugar efflux transporter
MPQMTLYLVNDLGASVPVAGLYYLTNFAAPLAGYWVGSLSDRQENRLTLYRACALLGGFGWLAMALATQVWMPFIIAGVVLSFSGGSMGLLFAAVRDDLSRQHSPAADRVVSAVRMAFTAGWIIGPVLGSWFGAVYGLRPLLFAVAVLTAGQILPLGLQRVPRYVGESRPASYSDSVAAPAGERGSRPHFQGAAVRVRGRLRAGDER